MTEVAEVLSATLRSAAVIMLNFNVPDRHIVPDWAEEVPDRKAETSDTKPKHEGPSGFRVGEDRLVQVGTIFTDIESHGFVFVRMVLVKRNKGYRMTVVLVREDLIKSDEVIIAPDRKWDFVNKVSHWLWDSRIYRNPGTNGGNFIAELGNPYSPRRKEPRFVLCLDDDAEFQFQPIVSQQERASNMSKELAALAGELKSNSSRTR